MDPLASKYPYLTPYNYTLNNPLKYIDPDGRDGGFTAAIGGAAVGEAVLVGLAVGGLMCTVNDVKNGYALGTTALNVIKTVWNAGKPDEVWEPVERSTQGTRSKQKQGSKTEANDNKKTADKEKAREKSKEKKQGEAKDKRENRKKEIDKEKAEIQKEIDETFKTKDEHSVLKTD